MIKSSEFESGWQWWTGVKTRYSVSRHYATISMDVLIFRGLKPTAMRESSLRDG